VTVADQGPGIEDIALARLIKKNSLKWEFVNLKGRVHCRMYQNFGQVLDGLSKNLFAVFGNILPVFLFIWLWLAIVFIAPVLSLIFSLLGLSFTGYSPALALATVGFSFLLWSISLRYSRIPLIQAATYPITIALAGMIAIRSAWFYYIQGSISWKGRKVKIS
jgi:chlorobactene glucosyltransferase